MAGPKRLTATMLLQIMICSGSKESGKIKKIAMERFSVIITFKKWTRHET